ncbi:hypothetical protein GOODEAATRI_008540 [Goodea atripinnis]|uniref:Uncharacterized protein n=1 Tax=Goodea atripinnis TaxID=208336 RepID=A0ABV0MSB2_9TELE
MTALHFAQLTPGKAIYGLVFFFSAFPEDFSESTHLLDCKVCEKADFRKGLYELVTTGHSTASERDILLRPSCVFNPTLLSTVYICEGRGDRLHRCCVLSTSAVLPPSVSFCEKLFMPSLLLFHLPLSFSFCSNPGPRTTRPSCHFLGLYEIASSFFKAEQKRPLARASWRPRGSAYCNPRNENKRHDRFQKISSTYHFLVPTPAGEGEQRQLREWGDPDGGGRQGLLSHSGLGRW